MCSVKRKRFLKYVLYARYILLDIATENKEKEIIPLGACR